MLTYAKVNGCSDDLTMIDVQQEQLEFAQSEDILNLEVLPMLNNLIQSCEGNFMFLCIVGLLSWCFRKKDPHDHVRHRDDDDY